MALRYLSGSLLKASGKETGGSRLAGQMAAKESGASLLCMMATDSPKVPTGGIWN